MRIVQDRTVHANTGWSFMVKKDEHVRIQGRGIVDTVVFNLDDLKERFDQARTKVNQGKVFISKGDVLYSKENNIMMTIVEDTYKGKHDLQYGMCSKRVYDIFWERHSKGTFNERDVLAEMGIKKREDLPDHGCYENLSEALKPFGIAPQDIPSPINLFQSMDITPEGALIFQMYRDCAEPGKSDLVELRAEMNCLLAVSACPWGLGGPVQVQVLQE